MKKVKIGVMGGFRGGTMIKYCTIAENAEVVAICDKSDSIIETQKENLGEDGISYYKNFDEFIKHDMDAVVLANYANEHAPYAIKCLKAGKHVFSEVLPVQTMKEAVELIETVEETKLIYAYGENYCYMAGPYEMQKLYKEGRIGEFEYGECEYIHNCEPIWHSITYGQEDHWRNNMYANFYCTHSIGPIIHMTGLKPISVIGFEGTKTERQRRNGSKIGAFGIEMITLENGGIIKSIHGDLYNNSVWYAAYGSKGSMETAREAAENGDSSRIYINADSYSGEYNPKKENYIPAKADDEIAKAFGHGGSDYYCMYNFVQKILGYEADTIDVYEALDMFLPGLFAYRSVLSGGKPEQIPDLRDKKIRDKYRNDTSCTDKKVAKDMLLPTFSKGTPKIEKKIYDIVREKWERAEKEKREKSVSKKEK